MKTYDLVMLIFMWFALVVILVSIADSLKSIDQSMRTYMEYVAMPEVE